MTWIIVAFLFGAAFGGFMEGLRAQRHVRKYGDYFGFFSERRP